ncbi:hypothetical protein P280DRAFT_460966 [Massarina eburnea CBS 473.64]|uniref:Rhodanese domain-containing protein n=1 Tax=Massarina eburnea CBS 473.64 TaxID=1395130 RepID=A0A6A6RMR5_9PLEO|nr:hypothetical protein P280DRAFT_460966 [Massarina eburnea CBS 473.64]
MPTPLSNQLLVDVRSPAEFSTGALANDLYTAVNIEYTVIDQLTDVYLARGVFVDKDDDITLYCRSGRRSNIALQTLRGMGYHNVRNIGGLEEAQALLQKEEADRAVGSAKEKPAIPEVNSSEKKGSRAKSFGALLEGLKELE